MPEHPDTLIWGVAGVKPALGFIFPLMIHYLLAAEGVKNEC